MLLVFREKELKQVHEKLNQAREALKLANQNKKNLHEVRRPELYSPIDSKSLINFSTQQVEIVSNKQSIHAAGGDTKNPKNNAGMIESVLRYYFLQKLNDNSLFVSHC